MKSSVIPVVYTKKYGAASPWDSLLYSFAVSTNHTLPYLLFLANFIISRSPHLEGKERLEKLQS